MPFPAHRDTTLTLAEGERALGVAPNSPVLLNLPNAAIPHRRPPPQAGNIHRRLRLRRPFSEELTRGRHPMGMEVGGRMQPRAWVGPQRERMRRWVSVMGLVVCFAGWVRWAWACVEMEMGRGKGDGCALLGLSTHGLRGRLSVERGERASMMGMFEVRECSSIFYQYLP